MTKYTRFEAIFRNETLVFTDRDPKFRNRLDVYNYITQYSAASLYEGGWRGRWYAYHCIGMDI